jgi:hypothetical protein
MGRKWIRNGATRVAAMAFLILGTSLGTLRGDEPGFFGRLFRGGQGSAAQRRPAPEPRAFPPASGDATPSLLPPPGQPGGPGVPPQPNPSLPFGPDVGAPALIPGRAGAAADPADPAALPPLTPGAAFSSPDPAAAEAPPIRPQPRNTRAVTEADPILTRISIGRSNDGSRFGMFLQVYADGTVIDGEGVRQASPQALRTLMQALQAPELSRLRGHCGTPSADYIELVQMVVFERRMGSLRANSFSYAGSPAGCDPAVRTLHAAVEAFQSSLSGSSTPPASAAPALGSVPPADAPALETLSLTPPQP